jgi:hypothetical protein
MLRLLGLVAVSGFMTSGAMAKPPMEPAHRQAKELTPMERDHYVPEQTDGKPEFTPMLPPSRGKAEESAGISMLKFDRDMLPKLTLPLGLAQLPSWITR